MIVDLMAPQTQVAICKFYGVWTVTAIPSTVPGWIIQWSYERCSIIYQKDLDELMNDPKFLELLTIEHLNGE